MSPSQRRHDLPPDSYPARGTVHEDDSRAFPNDVERDLADRGRRALCQRERHSTEPNPIPRLVEKQQRSAWRRAESLA